jgi:hypothetical protein
VRIEGDGNTVGGDACTIVFARTMLLRPDSEVWDKIGAEAQTLKREGAMMHKKLAGTSQLSSWHDLYHGMKARAARIAFQNRTFLVLHYKCAF